MMRTSLPLSIKYSPKAATANGASRFRFVLLVQDSVDGDRRLAGTAVTNDEFALTATNRYHRVYRLDTRLEWNGDTFSLNDAFCFALDGHHGGILKWTFGVDRLAECIHHPTEQFLTRGYFENAACGFDGHAFPYALSIAEDGRSHPIFFEVQDESEELAARVHRFRKFFAFAFLEKEHF